MALALFDLDQTLIAGDSDYLWGEFLVEKGLVDKKTYQQTNKKFFDDYKNGTLNMEKYLEFCLYPLSQHPMDKLLKLREEFVTEKIEPILYSDAMLELTYYYSEISHRIFIISATNEFIVEGIVRSLFGEHIDFLATRIEKKENKYTGKPFGKPCFAEGKIDYIIDWLEKDKIYDVRALYDSDTYFYSDSFNDLPLLKKVANPVAVNPDTKLREYALQNNWQIEDWIG